MDLKALESVLIPQLQTNYAGRCGLEAHELK